MKLSKTNKLTIIGMIAVSLLVIIAAIIRQFIKAEIPIDEVTLLYGSLLLTCFIMGSISLYQYIRNVLKEE